jgi:uncharacterized repeat protein (TIGR04076 family)
MNMRSINRIFEKIVFRVIKNRSGYTDKEIEVVKKAKWAPKLGDFSLGLYWLKVEMVKTNRCTVGWKEGDCLYFDFTGMLIKRKCPKLICTHAIAALSPTMYLYLDRISRGADPSQMQIDHVSCSDTGFKYNGLGNNLMRISYERMPVIEWMIYMIGMWRHLLFYSREARGTYPGGIE